MAPRLQFGDPLPPLDFARRLVTYTAKRPLQTELELIHKALLPFAPELFVEFELDDLFARVLYLGNLEKSVGDAIVEVAPQFSPEWVFERDVCLTPLGVPDDPLYTVPGGAWKWEAEQWALTKIHAESAWRRVAVARSAHPPVIVAIVDSGAQAGHEDFQSGGASTLTGTRILPPAGPNFADNTGHGTMLAGIIAAVSNNHIGIAGLGSVPITAAGPAAPVDIPVINPCAIKCNDMVHRPTAAVAAAGMVYAVIQRARVVNASWHVLDQGLLYHTIKALGSFNPPVLVVAAAGNSGSDNTQIPILPASYRGSVRGKPPLDNLIAVMATDHADSKCEFSNYGVNVDLAAPGEDVFSTAIYFVSPPLPSPTRIYSPAYRLSTGTSASAAHVSAAAGLLLAINDDWTPAEIRDHLVASGDIIPNLQGAGRDGPRLNLARAVRGPFSVTQPRAGVTLAQGAGYTVQWLNLYNAPIVTSVAVHFIDAVGTILGSFPGLPNTGSATVVVPNRATPQARIRVQCEQKNLYADSAVFQIA